MNEVIPVQVIKDTSGLTQKIRDLYAITEDLEDMFPGSKFTPDGHMVGSIGEVLVADKYGLDLLENNAKTHDAQTKDGKIMVQIKTTQTSRIALSSKPQHLIAIRIFDTGEWQEIYNGPGAVPWENAGNPQKNGQRSLSITKLTKMMAAVPEEKKIRPIK